MNTEHEMACVVVLSQAHARALIELLDCLLSRVSSEDHHLIEVRDRICDSIWLSGWLRENVYLELQDVELIDLLEAITVALNEQQLDDEHFKALEEIAKRLSIGSSGAAGPIKASSGRRLVVEQSLHSCLRDSYWVG